MQSITILIAKISRYCLLTSVSCLLALTTIAQEENERWLLGTGVTYCSYINNPGINLNVTYRLIGNLHIGPDFSALLTHEDNENGRQVKRKELEYNINAQQLFEVKERLALYPIVGINWSKVTIHPEDEDPDVRWITAFNAGGGIEWKFKSVRLFLESKWVSRLNKYDITTGILFPL